MPAEKIQTFCLRRRLRQKGPNMRERLLNAIPQPNDRVEDGPGRFRQAAEEFRQTYYGELTISPEQLIEVMQKYDPNFRVTQEDRDRAAERRARSERARDAVTDFEVGRMETIAKLGISGGLRHEQLFLDPTGGPESEAHNQKWLAILNEPDPAKKAEAIYDYMMNVVKPTVHEAINMDADQLIDNYARLRNPLSLAMDVKLVMEAGYAFTDQQIEELGKLQILMNEMPDLLDRVDIIASPYYESVPLERFRANMDDGMAFSREVADLEGAKGEKPIGPAGAMAEDLRVHLIHSHYGLREKVEYMISELGGDPRMICGLDGKRLAGDDIADVMNRGEPVFAGIPGQGMIPFTGKITDNGQVITQDEGAVARSMINSAQDMIRQAAGATPWWMITGSAQFKTMENNVSELSRLTRDMTFPPEGELAEQLENALRAVKESSRAYLEYKAGRVDGGVLPLDENGQLVGKNARETLRLRTAQEMERLSDQLSNLLWFGKEPKEAEAAMKQQLVDYDAEEARKAEERKAQEEREAQARAERMRLKMSPEEERSHTSKEDMIDKANIYKGQPRPERKYEGDPIPDTHRLLVNNVDYLAAFAALNQKIPESKQKIIFETMGNMVGYHLIQLDRAQNGGKEPFEPSLLEQHLTKNGKITLGENPEFRNMIGKLTPKRIEQFLMGDEVRTLGVEFLKLTAKEAGKDGKEKAGIEQEGKVKGGDELGEMKPPEPVEKAPFV